MVNTEQLQRVAMLKNLNYSFPLGYRFCPAEKELVLDNLRSKVRKRLWMHVQDNDVDDDEQCFNFPPGYRFVPTCKELVTNYLRNKILERPLPPSKIREANIYKHSPTELSEKYDKEGSGVMYFFTPRDRKYPEGERPKRSVDGNGFWKASGKAEEVENFDILIAKKRSLVYYQGSYKKPKKTDWLMQEFFMTGSSSSSARKGRPHNMKLDDWVLCKVYKNKKRDKEEDGGHPVAFPNSSTVVGESSELPMMQKLNSNVPAQSPNLLHRSQAMHAMSSQMSTYNNGQNGFQMPAAMLHSHEVQATSSQMPMYYNGQNFVLLNGGHGDTLWQQNNSHYHVDSKTNNQPEGIDMINNVPNEDTFWCGFLSSDNGDYSEPIDFGGVPNLDYMKSH